MKIIENKKMQLQVLTLKSGEILNLPPRSKKAIEDGEVSADIEIKAARGSIKLTTVSNSTPVSFDEDVD